MSAKSFRYACVGISLLVAAYAVPARHAAAQITIDFETPQLGASGSQIIDPYVANGVTFTALPRLPFTGVVGVVKNSALATCFPPADDNQKLGTGIEPPSNGPGFGAFPIRALFDYSIVDPVREVSVEFQALANSPISLQLFNDRGQSVALATGSALPPVENCRSSLDPTARTVLHATATEPVLIALMTIGGNSTFVIDNFEFGPGSVPVRSRPWSAIKSLYQ